MSTNFQEKIEFTAKYLWGKLGDIPVNDNGEIQEQFLHFQVGTNREEIWHWFEDQFDVSIAELMYEKENK